MAYQHTKLFQLNTALAARLGDPDKVFWSNTELDVYLVEALRTWNVFSAFWRDRGEVLLTEGVPFYDLNQVLSPPLIEPSVTDRDLVTEIQLQLLEPPNATGWSGTAQFTYYDVVQAIQRRRNQFLLETGCQLSYRQTTATSPSDGRMNLPDYVIDVRRAAWMTPEQVYNTLWRTDERELNAYLRGWSQNPGPPLMYSVAATPPLKFQIAPPPSDSGEINLLTVDAGQALDPAAGTSILGVPDDFAWVVKYGALADLLGKASPAIDPARQRYCESRWRDGIALAKITSTVMNSFIDGVSCETHSVFDFDAWDTNWMNTSGTPRSVGVAGMNIVAVNPTPDSSPHSLTMDLFSNFPVPTTNDYVQVGREEIDTILDLAVHIASFKMGGEEFLTTTQLYENMVRIAAVNNDTLRANAESFDILHDRSLKEGDNRNRLKSDLVLEPTKYETA